MRKFFTSLLFGSLIASSKQQAFDQTSPRVTTVGPNLNGLGLEGSSEWQNLNQKLAEIQQPSDKKTSAFLHKTFAAMLAETAGEKSDPELFKLTYHRAKEFLDQAIELDPQAGWQHYDRAMCKNKLNDFEGAKEDFAQEIAINYSTNSTGRSYFETAVIEVIQGRRRDSMPYFRKVVEIAPDDAVLELSRNELNKYDYLDRYNLDQLDYLKNDSRVAPYYDEMYRDLALDEKVNYSSRSDMDKTCSRMPSNEFPRIWNQAINCQDPLKREKMLLEALEVIENSKNNSEYLWNIYSNSGKVKLELGRYQEAWDDFSEFPIYHGVEKAFIQLSLQKPQEALEAFNKAIKTELSSIEIHNMTEVAAAVELKDLYHHRAIANLKLGNNQDALDDLSQEIQRNPNQKSLAYRAILNSHLGNKVEAEADLTQIDSLNSYSSAFYIALAVGALGMLVTICNCGMVRDEDRIGNFATEFRRDADSHVEGLAKQMVNLVLGLNNLNPQEQEAFRSIDPKKSAELLSQLITQPKASRENFLEEHLNEIILEEKIADLNEEKRLQIKELLQSALDQITPFQVNNLSNDIIKRVMPRQEGAVQRVLRDEDFSDFLKIFNDKAATTFGNVAASIQSADFVEKFCSNFAQDFFDQSVPKIEEMLTKREELDSSVSNVQSATTLVDVSLSRR